MSFSISANGSGIAEGGVYLHNSPSEAQNFNVVQLLISGTSATTFCNTLLAAGVFKLVKMRANKIVYSRLISKGNYENAKIEIELEVESGEKASEVFEAAKKWVEKRIEVEKLSDYTIEKARKVMDDKRNHTLAQIEEAEEILAKVKESDDELPF